jgi:hypothetical protein
MKRIAALALIALLAACGGDAGPTDRFSGTWSGNAIASPTDTVHIVLSAAQTGSTITGTGTASDFSGSEPVTFSGTSTAPSVNLVVIIESDTLNYSGTFVSSDSISGSLSAGGPPVGLSLKKQ